MRRELKSHSHISREEPRVNIHNDPNGYLRPCATVSFKEEEIAKKVFGEMVRGNIERAHAYI